MPDRLRLQEGWSTFILLWVMILTSGIAIVQADLIAGLHLVNIVGSIALVIGLMLAKSRFSPRVAHFFSLIIGLFVLFYLVGNMLPQELVWRERIIDIFERQMDWFQKAFGGGTSRDGLIFVIQTSAIYWVLGYTAAWFTFRYLHVWRAVVPTGLVLLSVVYYYTGQKQLTLYVAAYVVLALLFVAQTHLVSQEKIWRALAVRYERGIWLTFLRAGFLASLLALILAWSLPTMAASPIVSDAISGTRGPWRDFQDNWTRLFSALRSYGTNTSDPYHDTLVLGGPRSVGNIPIMDVFVPERLPYVYWQAIVYDTYEDGGWSTADGDSVLHFPDDGLLKVPDSSLRQEVKQIIYNYLPNSSFIYGAPDIVGSNKQIFVESTLDSEGRNLISSIRSRFVLQQGSRYEVISRVSTADRQSLRAASTDYPDYITQTYLQLPDTISAETLALAEELAVGQENPFDLAIAVRDYLRESIVYNDQIAAPPEGIDPVHYTLFVSKEGYCNYYASAMAIMLRSQGVPSRVASGYAQGEYSEEDGSYRVRAGNAHTWVEVFFPGYGWIQFEPTASIPLVERPESPGNPGDAFPSTDRPEGQIDRDRPLLEEDLLDLEPVGDIASEIPQDTFASAFSAFFTGMSAWQLAGGISVLILATIAVLLANVVNKRIESDVERSYGRMGSWAQWLDIPFRPAQTPYERADVMAATVPEGKRSIRNLTQQFVLRQFSRERSHAPGFDPAVEWQSLRPILLRRVILNRLRRWQKRKNLR